VLSVTRIRNLALTTAFALGLLALKIIFSTIMFTFDSSVMLIFHLSWTFLGAMLLGDIGLLLWTSSWVNGAGLPLCSIIMVFFWMFVFIFLEAIVAYSGSLFYIRQRDPNTAVKGKVASAIALSAVASVAQLDDSSQ
jgi:hypothetical protein